MSHSHVADNRGLGPGSETGARSATVNGDKILSLQVLRFLAAAVVWMHASHLVRGAFGNSAAFYPTDIGAAGVDVFFVLSGFVITRTGPLASPRPSAVRFLWRRWSRVAPQFYILSAPLIAWSVRVGDFDWSRVAATFLFWPAAGPSIVQPFLEPGWTLGFEMVFYAAVSLALLGGRLRRNLAVLAALAAGLVVARQFSGWNPLRVLANAVFLEFGAGVFLAVVWDRLRGADLRLGAALIAAALGAFVLEAMVGVGDAISWQGVLLDLDAIHRVIVFGVPAAALVAGAIICDRALGGRWLALAAALGDASYSIYLAQVFALPKTFILASIGGVWLLAVGHRWPVAMAITMIAGSIALGVAAYWLLEWPAQRRLKRLFRAPTPGLGRRALNAPAGVL